MSAPVRDSWLYDEAEARRRISKSEGPKSSGFFELNQPVSGMTFNMLTGAYRQTAKINDWGGGKSDSLAVSVNKAQIPDYPSSRQIKDPFESLYTQGLALEPPLPPDRLLNLTEENTLHSGCLMAKAVDACGRGWGFKPKKGKEGDKSLLKSDLPEKMSAGMELLTPDMTFGEMLYQAAWEKEAIGWAVWECVRMPDQFSPGKYAPVGAIYPLPGFTIRATVDPRLWVQIRAGRIRYFKKFGAKCDVDAQTGKVWDWNRPDDLTALAGVDPNTLASEVIIFREYTPRSLWYGIPKWISAVPTIAELSAIREFNVSWFASGGQTDYLVHFASESVEVATKMRDDARQQMQENAGRGHTNLLVAGDATSKVTAQKLGELLREGHFRFRRGDLAKEVLIAHNTPPYRIGWAEQGSLGGSTADQMLGAYKYGAIQPIQTVIEDRLMNTLFNPALGGIDTGMFRVKMEELSLDDLSKELEDVTKKIEHALMTPNEGREALGMEVVEAKKPAKPKAMKPSMDPRAIEGPAEDEQVETENVPQTKAEGDFEPARPEDPQLEQPEGEPELDENGEPVSPKPGEEMEPENQAEAMNKFYYKGHVLGEKQEAPGMGVPQFGPDGKPLPPKPPFGGKPNPFAPTPPTPEEKSADAAVDKTLGVIAEFEKTLRDAVRSEGTAVVNGTGTSDSPPSERQPSRRSRRQV